MAATAAYQPVQQDAALAACPSGGGSSAAAPCRDIVQANDEATVRFSTETLSQLLRSLFAALTSRQHAP